MIYPEFIKKNDTIGVSAPSDGITKKEKLYNDRKQVNKDWEKNKIDID